MSDPKLEVMVFDGKTYHVDYRAESGDAGDGVAQMFDMTPPHPQAAPLVGEAHWDAASKRVRWTQRPSDDGLVQRVERLLADKFGR